MAFVGETDRRRVLTGHLGCPLCEVEFRISGGAISFGPDTPGADPASPADPGMAVRVAALLGLGDRGAVVLLGPGLAALAPAIARSVERIEILVWPGEAEATARGDLSELARGVNPILGADPGCWPVRSGVLDGVALREHAPGPIAEAVRVLRRAGRLVLIEPASETLEDVRGLPVEELASDSSAWVGRRR